MYAFEHTPTERSIVTHHFRVEESGLLVVPRFLATMHTGLVGDTAIDMLQIAAETIQDTDEELHLLGEHTPFHDTLSASLQESFVAWTALLRDKTPRRFTLQFATTPEGVVSEEEHEQILGMGNQMAHVGRQMKKRRN